MMAKREIQHQVPHSPSGYSLECKTLEEISDDLNYKSNFKTSILSLKHNSARKQMNAARQRKEGT